ncbi:MAG TPA: DUF3473 domain-containing protein [Phycisphaerae bacterium]|nr:DUF3473 domain-containing protein [Phycisphaerae bacterium]
MIHAFTVDVEDYHNIMARDWLGREGPPTRALLANVDRILEWLEQRSVRGTFFVLGEVAATFPDLIRRIAGGGHELGVHGYYHRQLFKLTPASFREEAGSAKRLIEDISGTKVYGHRAPAFSIAPDTAWGLEVLAELGFEYDSSIFPIRGRRYGWPGFRLDIHRMELPGGRSIIEAPLTVVQFAGRRIPACGGGYVRHFPFMFTRWAMRRVHAKRPAIVYMHPYEIETPCAALDTSGLDAGAARRVNRIHAMQLRNRGTVASKLLRLLDEFKFGTLREVIENVVGERAALSRSARNEALDDGVETPMSSR